MNKITFFRKGQEKLKDEFLSMVGFIGKNIGPLIDVAKYLKTTDLMYVTKGAYKACRYVYIKEINSFPLEFNLS